MIHSTVRIIGSQVVGGVERRAAIGSGFLMTVSGRSGRRFGYVLTAHHVVWDQNHLEVQASDPNSPTGELHPPVEVCGWRQPLDGVDLVVARFLEGDTSDRAYQALRLDHEVLPYDKAPGLGSSIYYIGILAPLNRPMARSGTIGAVEQIGISHPGGYEYPVHLVDCRSYGGFSGSPCFVHETFAAPTFEQVDAFPEPLSQLRHRVRLCGMFTAHLTDDAPGVPASRYGVGMMLRSQEIWEALMTDELRQERDDLDTSGASVD